MNFPTFIVLNLSVTISNFIEHCELRITEHQHYQQNQHTWITSITSITYNEYQHYT